MTFIVATYVIASRPPECRPTGWRVCGRVGLTIISVFNGTELGIEKTESESYCPSEEPYEPQPEVSLRKGRVCLSLTLTTMVLSIMVFLLLSFWKIFA